MIRFVLAVLTFLLAVTSPTASDSVADRGREIFLFGRGVSAKIGPGAVRVDGRHFACKNCHGIGGAGKSEGTTRFPPIDWPALSSKRNGNVAYDEETFARALSDRIAPGGRLLDDLMPRYEMSRAAASSLLAYLKILPASQKTGVSSDEVIFAVVASERFKDVAVVMSDALNARFEELEARGGVFNRRLHAIPVVGMARVDRIERVFAVVGLISEDPALSQAISAQGIPNLFPFSPVPDDADLDLVRGAGASTSDAIEALVKTVVATGEARLSICAGDNPVDRDLADRALRIAQASKIDAGTHDLRSCFGDGEKTPVMLFSSSPVQLDGKSMSRRILGLLDQLAPQADDFRSHGFNLVLANVRPAAMRKAMTEGITLPAAHAALAARLIEEALFNAGRDLTRAGLIEAVDSLSFSVIGRLDLGYGRNPIAGSSAVEIFELEPEK